MNDRMNDPSSIETHIATEELCCPRCGYDQRGVMTTWTESWPLQGTCSECGMIFNWAELMMPEKFEPRWCVEFARQTTSLSISMVRTAWRSLRAIQFWSDIRMAYPVRWRRIAQYLLLLLLGAMLAMHVIQRTILSYRVWTAFNQQIVATAAAAQTSPALSIRQQIADLQQQVAQIESNLEALAMMQAKNSVPQGFDVEQARTYSEATMDVMKIEITKLQIQLQTLAPAAPPPVPQVPFSREWVRSLLTPWSATSGPAVVVGATTLQYPAPADLWHSSNIPSLKTMGAALVHSGWIAWLPLVFTPVGFIFLPMSRQRAKVRWAHVGRVFAYSMIIPFTALLLTSLLCSLALMMPGFRALNDVMVSAALWGVTIWVIVWWTIAIQRYLFIPHSLSVSLLLCLVALLLGITINVYMYLRVQYGVTFREVWSNVSGSLE